MGASSGISWTDATFNPVIGCTKVSPGCQHCYAETQNRLYRWNIAGWGPGRPRYRTSEANWRKPLVWAKQAKKDGRLLRIFCGSLCDILDPEIPESVHHDLWELITDTAIAGPVEWMLLTKRIENASDFLPSDWITYPPDYIRLGVTAENQEYANRRIPVLLGIWRGKTFVSIEPMLTEMDITPWTTPRSFDTLNDLDKTDPKAANEALEVYKLVTKLTTTPLSMLARETIHTQFLEPVKLDWVIVGGESGPDCRPMDLAWARKLRDQCQAGNVPYFFKQIGGYPDKRHNPEDWPEDLRIQEFPN